jgi:methylthioribose-1-phosphate isomerase
MHLAFDQGWHGNVLTHCNAGAIAVSAWGTALAPLHMAAAPGI